MALNKTDIVLNPIPGFVIKTLLARSTTNPKRQQGTKVFINVCSDAQIPEPQAAYGEELIMRVSQGEDWIVPIVPSKEKTDIDRKGVMCFVWDCCMHPRVVTEGLSNPAIKVLLIETCIELIEDRSSVELSREYVLPKLQVKGVLDRTILHSSQLGHQESTTGPSLASGVDSMVKDILVGREEGDVGMELESTGEDKGKKKSGKLLIQEIKSSRASNTDSIEVYSGPTLSYRVKHEPGNGARFDFQIRGANEDFLTSNSVGLLSNGKLLIGDLLIPAPNANNIEAIYTRDSGILHIYIY